MPTTEPSSSDRSHPVFVVAALAVTSAGVTPNTFRQWLFRQWHPNRRATWTIAVACDLGTREVVYSLPDVMRAEAATRRSAMTRTVRDFQHWIA